jgi:GNAT superfamily N-acetyltransferase
MHAGDIPAVVEMGRALHAESPRYRRFSFDAGKVERLLRSRIEGTLVTDAPGGAFVAEADGELVGGLVGYVAEPFFSTDKFASDFSFYVKPEYRGRTRAPLLLVRAFEAWAQSQGVVDLIPGTTTELDADKTVRFYEKLGYQMHGVVMRKEARYGA